MDDAYLAKLNTAGQLGQFLVEVNRFYRDFHHKNQGLKGLHPHDVLALAYLLDPTLFKTASGPVRVLTAGPAQGQTLFDHRQNWSRPNPWRDAPAVDVCLEVDAERLLTLFYESFI